MNTTELREEDLMTPIKPDIKVILRQGRQIMMDLGMSDPYDVIGEVIEIAHWKDKCIVRVEWDLKISGMKVKGYYDHKDLLKVS